MTWFRRETGAIPVHGFGDDLPIIDNSAQITSRFLANLQA
jgi:hypothetical protein